VTFVQPLVARAVKAGSDLRTSSTASTSPSSQRHRWPRHASSMRAGIVVVALGFVLGSAVVSSRDVALSSANLPGASSDAGASLSGGTGWLGSADRDTAARSSFFSADPAAAFEPASWSISHGVFETVCSGGLPLPPDAGRDSSPHDPCANSGARHDADH
jgi:hypothetical protein